MQQSRNTAYLQSHRFVKSNKNNYETPIAYKNRVLHYEGRGHKDVSNTKNLLLQ